jgi:hypothetical protein
MAVVSRISTRIARSSPASESQNRIPSNSPHDSGADHLIHANASTLSQIAAILAIILLNNYLLPADTLTAATVELSRIAQSTNHRNFVSPEEIAEVSGEFNVLDKDIVIQHNHIFQVTSSSQGGETTHYGSCETHKTSSGRRSGRCLCSPTNVLEIRKHP